MEKQTVTPGRIVNFYPSEKTKKKFENKRKDSYPAIVTDVNEETIDLTVFGVGETVYVTRVPHADDAEEGKSHWNWPARVEQPKEEVVEDPNKEDPNKEDSAE